MRSAEEHNFEIVRRCMVGYEGPTAAEATRDRDREVALACAEEIEGCRRVLDCQTILRRFAERLGKGER